ncbi:serine/threonine-protein kinase [Rhodococcus sp. IEGM 1318]|uniref:serine/threonine-protein kinase n=1 Tax=Rhodococcus sp. IEGM 1318 TaxID=3082226 RepID=UPI00295415CD|nr:serine/threonine-protein kinase [Rhodococcus sp. IEGM 1318]MDV8005792.1 serine/threonine-protein kinase [Rhodococcus sp. IEGM 1318]
MASDDKLHNHNRICPRVIGAVAGMWGGMRSSPSNATIDQILRKNGLDPRKYPGSKHDKVLRSLQASGAETAATLIRDFISRLKAEGFFLSEDPAAIANFDELQNAFAYIDAELTNSGDLIWDSENLQPDSYIDIESGDQIWTYDENGKEIGKGGYGIVYYGWDKDDNDVAIKKVPLTQGGDVRQLYREVNNTQGLRKKAPESIEHVLIPIAEVQDSESLYIIMPYAEDGSLKVKLSKEGKLDVEETLDILEQITKGLNELSTIGVLHRDIKTDNVLYQDGKWKLSDFGLSRFIENDTASYTMAFKGSSGYTAPEVINQEQKTVPSDLYSVGVIAYEMLAGQRPFTGDKDQVRKATLQQQPPSLPEEIPSPVRRIVSKLLKKNPKERYVDSRELLEAIDHAKRNKDKSPSLFAQALAAREEKTEAIRLSYELERQRDKELGDQKALALSDLDEKMIQAIEVAQRDEPSSTVNCDKNLNVWRLDVKGFGLEIKIWDEIVEDSGEHREKLLHSGEIYFLPEPHPPNAANTLNELVREGRIPDGNVVCIVNQNSGNPEWFLFSVNDTPSNAHGFNRSAFEQHWRRVNNTGPSLLDYTINTDPLTKDVIVDLLVHALDGRYLEYRFNGI